MSVYFLRPFIFLMFLSCNSEAEESSLGESVTYINAQTSSPVSNINSSSSISDLVSPNLNKESITFEEVLKQN